MKRNIKYLVGFAMGATDGEIGKVKDFYFDDATWTIRYLVVETGNWLSNRKVLIAPEALLQCDWINEIFPVNLTKEQIKNSPDVDTEQPVSKQHEMELYTHYAWANYWGGGVLGSGMDATGIAMPMPPLILEQEINENKHSIKTEVKGDPHLRSAKNVQGYNIHALDDIIGDVEDFIIDDSNWKIHYLVVDTGNWLPGKKVTISTDLIKEINWEASEVIINASVNQVKNSPEYDASTELTTEYETNLKDYYRGFISHQ